MLKFLRKYQKWMLVVFCGALMVAFLIPQAVSQFAPNPAKQVLGTTYDGQPITREEVQQASADVQMLRRLRVEALPALSLIPQTGSERDDALAWILIQRAAEHNGLGASEQASLNLIATVLGLEEFESLEARAKEIGVNVPYLRELGRQYLVAEQYRQLVAGIEYNLPEDEDAVTSPGLRRVTAMLQANQFIQQFMQNPQMLMQFAMAQGVSPDELMSQLLVGRGLFDEIQGHERFSAAELRYALQQQLAELDLTVVALSADDELETTVVDDAYVRGIFERFADDAPGTGEPYRLGYREPDMVKLEALRIPIEAARDAVAKTITEEDVRKYYEENKDLLTTDTAEAETEGEAEAAVEAAGPAKLTFELRDEIRQTLIQTGAEALVVEIAQQARQRLNEDARGLPDEGAYKVLPDDFTPTPLPKLASEIESEHGVMPELIVVDEFMSGDDMVKRTRFTAALLNEMPKSTVKELGFDREVYDSSVAGSAGLFASFVPAFSNAQAQQVFRLADYLQYAEPFLTDERRGQMREALQVGLPGQVLSDASRSTYVFRITESQPSRAATDFASVAKQVQADATKIKAYETLASEQSALLSRAAKQSIEKLMPNADAKHTLTGLTRGARTAGFIEGVASTRPILERAFAVTDDLLSAGGFDGATEADRLFAVELPGDYKLAVVRIDTFRPITQARYEEEAGKPASQILVKNLGVAELPEPVLSFEALQRYTGFKWDEGFEPEEDVSDAEDVDGDTADAE